MIIATGIGEDGERLSLEKVHEACFLLHADGNTESPFEFSSEQDALNFIGLLGNFRMECRLEGLFNG